MSDRSAILKPTVLDLDLDPQAYGYDVHKLRKHCAARGIHTGSTTNSAVQLRNVISKSLHQAIVYDGFTASDLDQFVQSRKLRIDRSLTLAWRQIEADNSVSKFKKALAKMKKAERIQETTKTKKEELALQQQGKQKQSVRVGRATASQEPSALSKQKDRYPGTRARHALRLGGRLKVETSPEPSPSSNTEPSPFSNIEPTSSEVSSTSKRTPESSAPSPAPNLAANDHPTSEDPPTCRPMTARRRRELTRLRSQYKKAAIDSRRLPIATPSSTSLEFHLS